MQDLNPGTENQTRRDVESGDIHPDKQTAVGSVEDIYAASEPVGYEHLHVAPFEWPPRETTPPPARKQATQKLRTLTAVAAAVVVVAAGALAVRAVIGGE